MVDKFFFFPKKNNPSYLREWKNFEVTLEINNTSLQGWLIQADNFKSAPFVIYFGGNAEDVSIQLSFITLPEKKSLLFVNYRGFGKSIGRPNQVDTLADALEIYEYVLNKLKIPPENIYLLGRSIGSSIAAYVASQKKVAGLILVTPFDCIASVFPGFLRWNPIKKWFVRYFNTSKYLESVECKIQIVSAEKDEVIPNKSLDRLLKNLKVPYSFIEIKDADHQDIDSYLEYSDVIDSFILGDKRQIIN